MPRTVPNRLVAVLTALAIGVSVSACGGGEDEDAGVLAEAAAYVQAGTGTIQFTDWAAVREAFDAEELVGASAEEQYEFLGELFETASIGPAYSQSEADAAALGFGPLDLDWEAYSFADEGGSLSILGAGEDLDFAAVEAALDACGYEASDVEAEEGTLFAKDLTAPCESSGDGESAFAVPPNPGLSNVAVLPEAGVLIASGDPDAVADAVAGDGEGLNPAIDDLGSQLDGSISGFLAYGDVQCSPLGPTGSSVPPEIVEEAEEQAAELGGPFQTLLASVEVTEGDPSGRFVLDFEDSEEAESQLNARREVFEEGSFAATQTPITDVFALDGAEVDDDAIVFEVGPPEEGAQLDLLSPVLNFDLPFAACA